MNRLVTWRYEFAIITARFLDENSAWPHLWPSTASDYVETVFARAPESTVFGLKSTEKSRKSLKNQVCNSSGRRSRKFESCHLDQNRLWELFSKPFFFASSDAIFEGRPFVVAPKSSFLCKKYRKQPKTSQKWLVFGCFLVEVAGLELAASSTRSRKNVFFEHHCLHIVRIFH